MGISNDVALTGSDFISFFFSPSIFIFSPCLSVLSFFFFLSGFVSVLQMRFVGNRNQYSVSVFPQTALFVQNFPVQVKLSAMFV